MSIKPYIAVLAVLMSGTALAQERLGTVADVKGLVTYTAGAVGGTAASGNPILDGTRFVATADGSALLRLDNNCDVRLEPGQSVTIVKGMNCAALLAAVQGGVGVAFLGSTGLAIGLGAVAPLTFVAGRKISNN